MKNAYARLGIEKDTDDFENPSEYCFKHPGRVIFLGASGQGKSASAIGFFLGIPNQHTTKPLTNYDNLVVFTGSKDSFDPLYDKLEEKAPKERFIRYGLSEFSDWLNTRKDEAKAVKAEGDSITEMNQTLVILDDIIGHKDYTKEMETFILSSRKYNVSQYILVQSWTPCATLIRENLSGLVLMRGVNRRQLLQVFELISPKIDIDKEQFIKMYQYATNHNQEDPIMNFLCVNFDAKTDGHLDPDRMFRAGYTQYLPIDTSFSNKVDAAETLGVFKIKRGRPKTAKVEKPSQKKGINLNKLQSGSMGGYDPNLVAQTDSRNRISKVKRLL